ncbi:Uncharacterized protein APZ42_016703 [Daphnia magna]|uniref:Uncharacterized protein n=1 Tax=Daphnia magna TaxID=35525 RepID=A0A165A3J2_9CRUS|nr:Uncharacterized protein APZ42_016703 [Daphnia magna]
MFRFQTENQLFDEGKNRQKKRPIHHKVARSKTIGNLKKNYGTKLRHSIRNAGNDTKKIKWPNKFAVTKTYAFDDKQVTKKTWKFKHSVLKI